MSKKSKKQSPSSFSEYKPRNSGFERLTDNKFIKISSILIALIAGTIGIYSFFNEKNIQLEYETISESNVLDVSANLSKLEILYDSTNLKKTSKNLKIYSIRIVNRGNENILSSHYDSNEPIGIKINNGKIIEKPEIVQSSSEYLKNSVSIFSPTENQINFSKVIIEPKEYFVVKFLVIHNNDDKVEIIPLGKLAGQKTINISNLTDSKDKGESTFLEKTIFGDFWILLTRFIFHFFLFLFIIAIIAVLFDSYNKRRGKSIRHDLITKFIRVSESNFTKIDDKIFEKFIKNGFDSFRFYKSALEAENINKLFDEESDLDLSQEQIKMLEEMLDLGIILKRDGEYRSHKALKKTLIELVDYIKESDVSNRFLFVS